MEITLEGYYEGAYTNNSAGIALIAIKNSNVVFEDYRGLANCEHGIPITSSTVFNVGSVSKQFTGIAILQLIESKKLCEQDLLVKYIPELKHYADEITIYHLAHHASGLADYNDLLWKKARNNALYSTNAEVLSLLEAQQQLCFKPGSKMEYCNSNYVLLAIIIERIMNMSLADYMKRNIFDAAGMKHTLVFDEKQPVVPNRAYGYEQHESDLKCYYVDTLATGCANVFTSISDMKLYDDILYGSKLLGQDIKKRIYEEGIRSDGEVLSDSCGGYSYGWMIQNKCGQRTLWHTGGDAGFRSIYVRFYEKRFSVILFCNCSNLNWTSIYKLVNDLYYKFNHDE
ncbi:serine hydrolase domain-containing protein [Paenibacillus sp. FSL P4-0338]|uniref:serine hydrolase domain-containing protein n=1 Tax=unclassified Paenibacillus TaxID=185978 RepID=UPI0003E229DF|nr:serine hydrolase domain-containing protein [Paenibacillus sp. FSL R7-269]ETT53130.1 penicillin-binding protein [Paenibacillus sp. FSL R7-269]